MRRRRWPWELHAKDEALLESLLSPSCGSVADPGEELKIPVVAVHPGCLLPRYHGARAVQEGKGKRERQMPSSDLALFVF
jgi:hypothetical protein